MSGLLVGVGGALGAVLRHLVSTRVRPGRLPHGTLAVNALGSLVLGFLTAAGAGETALLLVGTGACGAFTTFSTFSVQTVELWENGDVTGATLNAAANLVAALIAVGVGWWLAP